VRHSLGWFYLSFLAVILALNVAMMVYDLVKSVIDACRRRKIRKRIESERKLKNEQLMLKNQFGQDEGKDLENQNDRSV